MTLHLEVEGRGFEGQIVFARAARKSREGLRIEAKDHRVFSWRRRKKKTNPMQQLLDSNPLTCELISGRGTAAAMPVATARTTRAIKALEAPYLRGPMPPPLDTQISRSRERRPIVSFSSALGGVSSLAFSAKRADVLFALTTEKESEVNMPRTQEKKELSEEKELSRSQKWRRRRSKKKTEKN